MKAIPGPSVLTVIRRNIPGGEHIHCSIPITIRYNDIEDRLKNIQLNR